MSAPTTSRPLRIAMWSGPRNISTALMRSFESRGDAAVSDEPLYAFYLRATGLDHPLAAEIVADGETDWQEVARALTGPVPGGKPIWYQKHMAHHLLPEVDRGWLGGLTHAFLIREPRAMLASLHEKRALPGLADTGLPQQVEIFRWARAVGVGTPPVVDARDVLEDPARVLGLLCEALGIEFRASMLRWEPGLRPTDGIWASHWYDAVATSTGFAPYCRTRGPIPAELDAVLRACEELYAELHACRLC